MTAKMGPYRIPADLRPVLIERIRELNAQGQSDSRIGMQLGYASETIRNLRHKAGIDPIPAGTGNKGRPATEQPCPTCTQPVEVIAGMIADHKALLGRRRSNGVHIADPCPASGASYMALLNARKDYVCAP